MSLPDVLTVDQDFLPLLFSLIFQFITLHKENILHRPAYWVTIKTLELNVLMNEHYSSQLENLKILKKNFKSLNERLIPTSGEETWFSR